MRYNKINEELISLLKSAGCYLVFPGIDSGNEYLRNVIIKRNISENQIIESSILLKKYRILHMTGNILGLPDENIAQALETFKINKKIRPAYAWSAMFQPYPFTELYNYTINNSLIDVTKIKNSISYKQIFNQEHSILKTNDIRSIIKLHLLFNISDLFVKFLIKLPLTYLYKGIYVFDSLFHNIFILKEINVKQLVLLKYPKF